MGREHRLPRFDGSDIVPNLDIRRLKKQIDRVKWAMRDKKWKTLKEIHFVTLDPESSISAQLRNLRKERFGGWNIEKRRLGDPKLGQWEYRLNGKRKDI